jgi:integrase
MSVRRDKLGRWTVDILFRHAGGSERRVTRASAKWTKRDGEAWERDARRHLADGTFDQWREEVQSPAPIKLQVVPQVPASIAPTLEKFVDERWLPVHPVAAKNSDKTVLARRWQLGLIKAGLGQVHLDQIDDERTERFAAELATKKSRKGKPYAEKSVKEILALLKQVLGKAKRWKVIAEVPEFPKVVVAEQPYEHFTADETVELLDALEDEDERLLVLFAVRTGARPGEQIALEWDDVNWVKRIVEFNKQMAAGSKKVTPTKTKKIRSVPLTSDLYAALKRHRHLRGKRVFCRPDGSAWDVHAWHTILHRALRKAGLKKVTWYALRHSFGSQAVAAGVPLNVVQQWMGHSTITMTMRYVHAAANTGDWKLAGGASADPNADIVQTPQKNALTS